MTASSLQDSPIGRKIETLLSPRSLAPRVYQALQALGYSIRSEAFECADGAISDPKLEHNGVWLVDENRLRELPGPGVAPHARILLISSSHRASSTDRRIIAQTPRPARLAPVYSMIQAAVEVRPRRTPRIQTNLSARCLRAKRQSTGAILSLSEGGCLLRTPVDLKKGLKVNLQFALPDYGLVSLSAECRYMRKGDAGLEFIDPAPDIRHSIAYFVTLQLAENPWVYMA